MENIKNKKRTIEEINTDWKNRSRKVMAEETINEEIKIEVIKLKPAKIEIKEKTNKIEIKEKTNKIEIKEKTVKIEIIEKPAKIENLTKIENLSNIEIRKELLQIKSREKIINLYKRNPTKCKSLTHKIDDADEIDGTNTTDVFCRDGVKRCTNCYLTYQDSVNGCCVVM